MSNEMGTRVNPSDTHPKGASLVDPGPKLRPPSTVVDRPVQAHETDGKGNKAGHDGAQELQASNSAVTTKGTTSSPNPSDTHDPERAHLGDPSPKVPPPSSDEGEGGDPSPKDPPPSSNKGEGTGVVARPEVHETDGAGNAARHDNRQELQAHNSVVATEGIKFLANPNDIHPTEATLPANSDLVAPPPSFNERQAIEDRPEPSKYDGKGDRDGQDSGHDHEAGVFVATIGGTTTSPNPNNTPPTQVTLPSNLDLVAPPPSFNEGQGVGDNRLEPLKDNGKGDPAKQHGGHDLEAVLSVATVGGTSSTSPNINNTPSTQVTLPASSDLVAPPQSFNEVQGVGDITPEPSKDDGKGDETQQHGGQDLEVVASVATIGGTSSTSPNITNTPSAQITPPTNSDLVAPPPSFNGGHGVEDIRPEPSKDDGKGDEAQQHGGQDLEAVVSVATVGGTSSTFPNINNTPPAQITCPTANSNLDAPPPSFNGGDGVEDIGPEPSKDDGEGDEARQHAAEDFGPSVSVTTIGGTISTSPNLNNTPMAQVTLPTSSDLVAPPPSFNGGQGVGDIRPEPLKDDGQGDEAEQHDGQAPESIVSVATIGGTSSTSPNLDNTTPAQITTPANSDLVAPPPSFNGGHGVEDIRPEPSKDDGEGDEAQQHGGEDVEAGVPSANMGGTISISPNLNNSPPAQITPPSNSDLVAPPPSFNGTHGVEDIRPEPSKDDVEGDEAQQHGGEDLEASVSVATIGGTISTSPNLNNTPSAQVTLPANLDLAAPPPSLNEGQGVGDIRPEPLKGDGKGDEPQQHGGQDLDVVLPVVTVGGTSSTFPNINNTPPAQVNLPANLDLVAPPPSFNEGQGVGDIRPEPLEDDGKGDESQQHGGQDIEAVVSVVTVGGTSSTFPNINNTPPAQITRPAANSDLVAPPPSFNGGGGVEDIRPEPLKDDGEVDEAQQDVGDDFGAGVSVTTIGGTISTSLNLNNTPPAQVTLPASSDLVAPPPSFNEVQGVGDITPEPWKDDGKGDEAQQHGGQALESVVSVATIGGTSSTSPNLDNTPPAEVTLLASSDLVAPPPKFDEGQGVTDIRPEPSKDDGKGDEAQQHGGQDLEPGVSIVTIGGTSSTSPSPDNTPPPKEFETKEFETRVQIIQRFPELREIEETFYVKEIRLEKREKVKVPKTKVVTEKQERKEMVPIIKMVPKTRIKIVHSIRVEWKDIIEMVPVIEMVEVPTMEVVPTIVDYNHEEKVYVPVVVDVPRVRKVDVPTGKFLEAPVGDYINPGDILSTLGPGGGAAITANTHIRPSLVSSSDYENEATVTKVTNNSVTTNQVTIVTTNQQTVVSTTTTSTTTQNTDLGQFGKIGRYFRGFLAK